MRRRRLFIYCKKCQSEIPADANFCSFCGKQIKESTSTTNNSKTNNKTDSFIYPHKDETKSVGLVLLLSILLPGLGQVYLGQTQAGLGFIIISVFLGTFLTLGTGYVVAIFLTMLWGYRDVKKLNNGERIHKWAKSV